MPGFKWVRYSGARYWVPEMVTVGRDADGANLVVGRAMHHGDMLPAKVKPEHGVAYVAYAGGEHTKHDFEILMQTEFRWIRAAHGHVPQDAVEAGRTNTGEVLYVGRAWNNGVMTVGKIQRSHGCLYVPFDGREIAHQDYEVLVLN